MQRTHDDTPDRKTNVQWCLKPGGEAPPQETRNPSASMQAKDGVACTCIIPAAPDFIRALPHIATKMQRQSHPMEARSRDDLHNPRESVVVRIGMGRKASFCGQ